MLTREWLDETLTRNPALSVQVMNEKHKGPEEEKKRKERNKKYRNNKVYVYEDRFAGNSKELKEHGAVIETYDSTKEYYRWIELNILQEKELISELERQKPLCIQEPFSYEGKKVRKIEYRADFCYKDKDGRTVIEDVKGYDKKKKKYIETEAFRLKWKILKAKYPDFHFVLF